MQMVFNANDESDTDRFGAALAHVLPASAVVALVGTLGAGKTRLVQAVAKAIGIDPREVVSPTFVLVHEYDVSPGRHGDSPAESRKAGVSAGQNPGLPARAAVDTQNSTVSKIYHVDAYRIRDEDEFLQLGPEEYFESGGWTFIEWADRVAHCLPREYLQIATEVTGPTARRFTLTAVGERFARTIDELRSKVAVPATAKHAEP